MAQIVCWWDELRKTLARMKRAYLPPTKEKGTKEPSEVCANKY